MPWWKRTPRSEHNPSLGFNADKQVRDSYSVLSDRYRMLFRLQIALGLGCLFLLLYAFHFRSTGAVIRIASVGTLIAGAALFSGFVLGFIFGIPRTPKPASGASGATTAATAPAGKDVESNSNLVEISDWLTKILVGVGLVELNKIPSRLHDLAVFLGPGLRAHKCGPEIASSQAFSIAIVLFFFGAGFLFGYLWTRLYFEKALAELADEPRRRDDAWEDATTAQDLMAADRLGDALRVVDKALAVNPENAQALAVKGMILKRMAQASGKTELLTEALAYATKAAALMPNRGGPIYNVACYQALLGADPANVLKNLRTAFQLNPGLKAEARKDPDLASLHDNEEFKGLTKQ
jgi:hypothetical protein